VPTAGLKLPTWMDVKYRFWTTRLAWSHHYFDVGYWSCYRDNANLPAVMVFAAKHPEDFDRYTKLSIDISCILDHEDSYRVAELVMRFHLKKIIESIGHSLLEL
jgi:hypothetical protein